MERISLKDNPKIKEAVSKLYLSAFPEDERPPLFVFYNAVYKFKRNQVIGYYDNGEFIGFVYLVFYRSILYIAFFAVSPNKRGQGYGTAILNDIRDSYPNFTKLLCFEEVDTKYVDHDVRLRRQNFYYRNGYIDNDMKTREGDVVYQSVYIGKNPITFKTYKMIFDHTYGAGAHKKYLKEEL